MTPERGTRASGAKKRITGILQVTRKGVGYVAWPKDQSADVKKSKERDDIEVAPENLRGALNGDTVAVELVGLFPRPKGLVVTIVERAKTQFVATLKKQGESWIAVADDARVYRPFSLTEVPQGAQEGTKALLTLTHFDGTEDPRANVLEIIGAAGEHRVEMNAIVLEHGFRTDFSYDVASEARQIEDTHAQTIAQEAPHRRDFRGITTLTIDPADAKDFDDALSLQNLSEDEYEVGVHIADVSFFVRPNTPLDVEAQKRGTSVYLVDATIPMLPHELSGNVCSLKEGEDRLAFSAIFRIRKDGRVLDRSFARTIIRSNKRFTYEEAQGVLDTGSGPFLKELTVLRDLARILKGQREKEGAIDFGDNEFRFELDESGKPIRVVRKVRIETNSLIEEFMLLANREVARFVSGLAQKVPEKNAVFLYRIHDEPKAERIEELATFVRAVGYEFTKSKKTRYTARDIASLLEQIEGKPEEHLIRTATLRSMAKAIYSTQNIGHFGLAFEYYTHFTSPIRRYPDLLVHRIVESHLSGKPLTRKEFGSLEQLCLAASQQEAKAVSAERESIRYKQVEFMQDKVGQEFSGVISGVTDWGLYVEEESSGSEGLVRVRSIGDDFYNHDQKAYALIGERTKKKYTLGDRVRVKLTAADLSLRTLDFELV